MSGCPGSAGHSRGPSQGSQRSGVSGSPRTPGPGSGDSPRSRDSPSRDSPSRNSPRTRDSPSGNSPRSQGSGPTAPQVPVLDVRNLDLGLYQLVRSGQSQQPENREPRPENLSKLGREINVGLNAFQVKTVPQRAAYMYDVAIAHYLPKGRIVRDEDIHPRVRRKVWDSKPVQTLLAEVSRESWIYDGKKLAWCNRRSPSETASIRLDPARPEGMPAADAHPNGPFRVTIRCVKKVLFDTLNAWLRGDISWEDDCLQSMVAMDHILRETAARRLVISKRSAFNPNTKVNRHHIDNAIEAARGIYAALRASYFGPKVPAQIVVNADVAHGTFWRAQTLMSAMENNSGFYRGDQLWSALGQALSRWREHPLVKKLNSNFRHVEVYHRPEAGGNRQDPMTWKIERFLGQDAGQYTFTDDKTKKQVSLKDYWQKKYGHNARLKLPVVEMTKKIQGRPVVVPVDALAIGDNQRYTAKLDGGQTTKMLNFAVCVPRDRWTRIEQGLDLLDWQNDRYLKSYGLNISKERVEVKGRQLLAPDIQFNARGVVQARQCGEGRWRIDGKKFLRPNRRQIEFWAVVAVGNNTDHAICTAFFNSFVKIYSGHGADFHPKGKSPYMCLAADVQGITGALNKVWNHFRTIPSIVFFVLPSKDAEAYREIKRISETTFGAVTQCLQYSHVQKAQEQYISNVCMKVNAKLGGSTCKAVSNVMSKISPKFYEPTTMIIGADVTHPAPGTAGDTASIAAITFSNDKELTYFPVYIATNGHRGEIIKKETIMGMKDCFKRWMEGMETKRLPDRIVYLRDGLGDTQYVACLKEEVAAFKACLNKIDADNTTKFTVLIASKRHHVRFFPGMGVGDKNGNPKPGVLVETGVTSHRDHDFYLCTHSAIKGTARPVHFYVLLNENKMTSEQMQQMCFDHCFQYQRATTPVSLPPAVYYAHLAAARALCHVDPPGRRKDETPEEKKKREEKEKAEKEKEKENARAGGDKKKNETGSHVKVPDLLPLPGKAWFQQGMWYI